MLPIGTPVLLTWPGYPPLRGTVAGMGHDGGCPVFHVVSSCGCSVLVTEAALTDLRLFPDVAPSAFSEAGRA